MKTLRCFICLYLLLTTASVYAQIVDIPDPNFRGAITETLELPADQPITQQEMARLTELSAPERGIIDLTGLEYATNLQSLNLFNNQVQDIAPLVNLTNLTYLNLAVNRIKNLEPLADLVRLELLDLWGNQVKDIKPLANLIELTGLVLTDNQISDLTPLANLTALEALRLDRNAITDITPLIGLKNLRKLWLADNPIHDLSLLAELEGVELDIEIDFGRLDELNVVLEIPDPNLEWAIRENLFLTDDIPLTQLEILQLKNLQASNRGIIDLTGLEYATNLEILDLGGNQIQNIHPLASLTHLTSLGLWNNKVKDITPLVNITTMRSLDLSFNYNIESLQPLVNLTQLRYLSLIHNRVKDLSPLANMTSLNELWLRYNQVGDLTPLTKLIHLKILDIRDNLANDFTPVQGLNLTKFYYDEPCDIAPFLPLVTERIKHRSFPSVFQAWDHVQEQDHLTINQRYALHDLFWSPDFEGNLGWDTTLTEPTYGLATSLKIDFEPVHEIHQQWLELNPNMIFLAEVRLHNHFTLEAFPPDSDFWLKDSQGQIVQNDLGEYLINFLKPEVQNLLINRIIAIARCGFYDGVLLDGAGANGNRFVGRQLHTATNEEITQAMRNILGTVRANTRDDFLIVVNSNDSIIEGYPELVNGNFMETFKDQSEGYTHDSLQNLEHVLLWSEENLRSPQINCLEIEGIPTEPLDSPNNRRWMRVATTLSLTHSDGYVLYNTGTGSVRVCDDCAYPWGPGHEHIWYDFWEADLGRPLGPKAQPYQNIEGLFIREFTNGWAVYNRSGKTQTITLPRVSTGVSSNKQDITHLLTDLNGEIYLRKGKPFDLNRDGTINVLDLLFVSQHFGTAVGDVNGDGTTNILDLTLIARRFSQ